MEERIGPPLHGGLSLGQLCHYAGITINGDTPELPPGDEMAKCGLLDLSGRTTLYNFKEDSTPTTAQRLYDTLALSIPSFSESYNRLHFTIEKNDMGGMISRPLVGHETRDPECSSLIFNISYFGFHHLHKISYATDIFKRDLGLNLRVAGQEEHCRYSSVFINAHFPKEDEEQLSQTIAFDQMLNSMFPLTLFACFDLKKRERRTDKDYTAPLDPEISKWILDGEDRWRHVFYDGRDPNNPEYLGYRPEG